ncbi:uncharacterized protein involved in propanediol utilization [Mesorhizobium soli]|uniref:GHMP family kinase ATP-binding protein n=1 Tax=Pseudaminobacter soli (ex Li et al. 2025) TaxID=1295366 RepID=UPI002475CC96|nr:kinase [Mesorhizobium soli]MDH6234880.1 uncharacterized protein involved in propanediol utilization [Mesorhizobium soli]
MTCIAESPRSQCAALGKPAKGQAHAHHGELLQGAFEDDQGRLHRGLVTLPLDSLRSTAIIKLKKDNLLSVKPRTRMKALRAAQLALEHFGHPTFGGRLSIESDIPVGHGYGSSTADVVASIRAVAAALGTKLLPSTISRLAVAAETASDAIAFEAEALLFAQREGVVLEHFGGALPPFVLVGFKANDTSGINTIELAPARYSGQEIQLFRVLRGMIARAVQYQDPRLLGRAATLSAHISQRHLPKPFFDFVIGLAHHHQAFGIQVAHSGSLFGLMLDPRSVSLRADIHAIVAALKSAGFQDIDVFSVNGAGGTHEL